MSDRLKEIEEREKAATRGPWVAGDGVEDDLYERPSHVKVPNFYEGGGCRTIVGAASGPDAEFVAHAREDVPWLAARVRELEMTVDAERGEKLAAWKTRDALRDRVKDLQLNVRALAENGSAAFSLSCDQQQEITELRDWQKRAVEIVFANHSRHDTASCPICQLLAEVQK